MAFTVRKPPKGKVVNCKLKIEEKPISFEKVLPPHIVSVGVSNSISILPTETGIQNQRKLL